MKISTDAVLLGALATAQNPRTILDIGTGTGVIALMLAQRYLSATVEAIEIDADAAGQASDNFAESPFASRLQLIHGRIQDLEEGEKFDLIVSNPPFFPNHLKSQNPKRTQALHTDELPFEALIEKVRNLLSQSGSFWLILPPEQMRSFETLVARTGFFPLKKINIRDRESKPIHRVINELRLVDGAISETELILKDENSNYSGSYSALLGGFLLGF